MTFTILQWNIMFSENIPSISEFIKRLNPDIVCLQELTQGHHNSHPDTGAYLVDTLGYHSFYAYGPMVLPTGQPTLMGNGLFSRYPLTHTQRIILQPGLTKNGQVLQDERLYLQAHIKLPSATIITGTTHLPFHPRFRTTPHKQAMVEQILAHIPSAPTPYVFTGDLNTTPGSKAAHTMRRHLTHAGPNLQQKTWTTKPFHIGPYSYETLNWRLDYILHQNLPKPRTRILETELSDHLPILAEFQLNSK